MGRFKKGLVVGGLLGAGLVWLNTTKKGREMRDEILDYAANIYADVKEKILESENWDKVNKVKYVAMVRETLESYDSRHNLSANVKQLVEKLVINQWKNLRGEIKKKKTKK